VGSRVSFHQKHIGFKVSGVLSKFTGYVHVAAIYSHRLDLLYLEACSYSGRKRKGS
jgi:hypothetical protein